ncbi:Meiotically up-regulated gene 180 protein [Termitomyces sp. T112]|nr:Meiotically up-regulated gene 180 protein [Termitomyces sp. T112]
MPSVKDTSCGNPSLLEKVGAVASIILYLPLFLGWTLINSPFHRTNKHKTWTRIVGDRLFYFLSARFNIKQLQWVLGDTQEVYKNYMKSQGFPLVTDELAENGRLLWFGERRTDRVILYFHGGAFLVSVPFFVLSFWKLVRSELEAKGKKTGFALLQYSPVPTATFPTQLKQAVLAVQHLISMGVEPQNIQLTGDSAGGNLVLQLLSHMLHPVTDVPRLTITAPFSGVYLMSPWVSLTGKTGSMITNDDSDSVGIKALTYWGRIVLDGVPEKYRSYLEPYYAPEDWFMDLSTVVRRVFVTDGDAECLRDEIAAVADHLSKKHPRMQFILQKHGIHDDPYFDFLLWPQKVQNDLTPLILDFFASGFE